MQPPHPAEHGTRTHMKPVRPSEQPAGPHDDGGKAPAATDQGRQRAGAEQKPALEGKGPGEDNVHGLVGRTVGDAAEKGE